MFNGKQIQALEKKVDSLINYIVKRDYDAKVAVDDAPAKENKKVIDLLSRQAKLIAKVDSLKKENTELEKRARPKRKNHKPITSRRGGTRVTEDEKAMFLELYDKKMGLVEMSIATGRSASCISNWIKKLRPELVMDLDEEAIGDLQTARRDRETGNMNAYVDLDSI